MTSSSASSQPIGSILVLCTGNQCRSPMAAAILNQLLAQKGVASRIESAGFVSEGATCPPEVNEVMSPLGYDLLGHRSRIVNQSMLSGADLVIGMTRQHVIDLSLTAPQHWKRAFTLAELVRLGEAAGHRHASEGIAAWVERVGKSRTRPGLLSLSLSDDVPDPIGRSLSAYLKTRDTIRALCTRLADLLAPV